MTSDNKKVKSLSYISIKDNKINHIEDDNLIMVKIKI